jgi:hypothetical protein
VFPLNQGRSWSLEASLNKLEILIDEGHKVLSFLKLPVSCDCINNTLSNTVRTHTRCASTPSVVFGRDSDLDMIRKMLRDVPADDKPYAVVGIHGIPGSGKTTLTQYVCDKERDDGYFNLIMWVLLDLISVAHRIPDGPPHPCALIGGAQLNPSWWAPVAPRYKKEVGASGTRHEVHRPPPPHPQSTLADLSQARLRREALPAITLDAPASTPSSRTRPHRRPPRPCTPTAGPPRAPRAAPPWRACRHPLLPKGTKVLPCSSLSLSISLSISRLSKPKGVFLI